MHEFKVDDRKVLRMIRGVEQKNRIKTNRIWHYLNVDSVEDTAKKSRLRWFGNVWMIHDCQRNYGLLAWLVLEVWGMGMPRRLYLDSVKSNLSMRGFECYKELKSLLLLLLCSWNRSDTKVKWMKNIKNRIDKKALARFWKLRDAGLLDIRVPSI